MSNIAVKCSKKDKKIKRKVERLWLCIYNSAKALFSSEITSKNLRATILTID